jgi:hypothetical protein
MSIATTWGTTDEERARAYPCDALLPDAQGQWYRAVSVAAPPSLVFRWLCQLRVAPYSYDWIDNLGRRSPQQLTPGLEDLAVGQRVMTIFDLASFERDRHITITLRQRRLARWIFGRIAMTYAVVSLDPGTSRVIAKIAVQHPPAPIGWLTRIALPWGDWIMMRRQFLNLKRLAERNAGVFAGDAS